MQEILNCSQQLRMIIIHHGFADRETYANPPRSLMTWMQNEGEIFAEDIGNLVAEGIPEDSDSDNDSFLSASETAALEVCRTN